MGYIGENPTMSWIMKNIALILVITIVSVAVIAYAIKRRNETKERKAVNEPPEDVNPQNGKESKEE
jgi:cbb3-type cytochrome oxidase subunit 3